MDLSLDIEQNSSVTSCLRQFSASEMLCHKDKFYCDECCGLQEAEKRFVTCGKGGRSGEGITTRLRYLQKL